LTERRTEEFQRNVLLEQLLSSLNSDLIPSESKQVEKYMGRPMAYPLILIMGPLRSGTTLFMQWLSNTGVVAYPTNLLSRFYQAPVIGSKAQLLLTDPRFNFRDELGEFAQQAEYMSENGKTKGVLAPNEFWYFWRRFLADSSRDVWSDYELKESMDIQTMKSELVGMMDVFEKPFAAKGMLFNYNIPFLNAVLDKVVFVHIQRDVAANAESILQARERQLGSREAWYSFKIPEYEALKTLTPEEQAVGQVASINRAISKGLEDVEGSRKVVIQHEDFCRSPEKVYNSLIKTLSLQGYESSDPYQGVASFSIHERKASQAVLRACEKWKS